MVSANRNEPRSIKKAVKAITATVAVIIVGSIAITWVASLLISSPHGEPSDQITTKDDITEKDLIAESDRLEALALESKLVSTANVMMRKDITHGRQIIIEATSDSDDIDSLKKTLRELQEIAWNNQLYVPSDVRVSVIGPNGTTVDATDLGHSRRGVGSDYLYEHFGPPAANPVWRP